ncbi:uncharacterized protein LOC116339694 [Contarinia nasturtii]|uniref:uncharacterized protein LOC116339694 n=1 Tax=Contarinia nasturtii TaxID=265458 RepID=UPI0012D3A0AD|nr:uncharacterized protein LOC116339694 [Contarinia nasturtii]
MMISDVNFIYLYFICLINVVWASSCEHDSCVIDAANKRNIRNERALLFPPSSTIGILAAIAVPLDDRKNVFLSYNFEANYNSPFRGSDYIPGPLDRLQIERSFGTGANNSNANAKSQTENNFESEESNETISMTETTASPKARRSLITRTNIYKTIERKLNAAGYNGHDCLLRAICDAADIPLGLHNGVLGDLMHIIFTPSSSAKENILYDFYDAEMHGMLNMCKRYSKNCPESILDWISLFEKGFNANHCILKAICETAQYQFGNENGLLGDIIHILFTPTTSKNEGLPTRFYEAEMNGQLNLSAIPFLLGVVISCVNLRHKYFIRTKMERNIFNLVLILLFIEMHEISSSIEQSRQKRVIPTPYSPFQTMFSLSVGLAIPVDNGRGDIFMSLCVQSNFNQPTFSPLEPPLFQTIHGDQDERKLKKADFKDGSDDETIKTKQNEKNEKPPEIFKKLLDTTTRKKFFKLLEHKLKIYGFNGESCLLKAICEASSHLYGKYNGVVGDIVHILFSPSTSRDEDLPFAYYKAEQHGNAGRYTSFQLETSNY